MKKKLYKNNKIEVKSSKIQGYGVFAKKDIKKDEILEECHYIEVDNTHKVHSSNTIIFYNHLCNSLLANFSALSSHLLSSCGSKP